MHSVQTNWKSVTKRERESETKRESNRQGTMWTNSRTHTHSHVYNIVQHQLGFSLQYHAWLSDLHVKRNVHDTRTPMIINLARKEKPPGMKRENPREREHSGQDEIAWHHYQLLDYSIIPMWKEYLSRQTPGHVKSIDFIFMTKYSI